MSFNGYFLVGKSENPLSELPSVRRCLAETIPGRSGPGGVLGYRADGPWQMVQCDATDPEASDMVARRPGRRLS